jgi:hypothetical protein
MRFSAGVALFLTASWLLPAQSTSKRAAAASPKTAGAPAIADPAPAPEKPVPAGDRLTYDVEWRLIHAGTVVIVAQKTHADLHLDSAGMVSSLFKIHDVYSVDYDEPFCASSAVMDSLEGKRHHETKVTYDRSQNRATYLERDVLKDSVMHTASVDIPNCVHEVIGAFLKLRGTSIAPGQSMQIAMSDGRRSATVKIDAQELEEVKTPAGEFKAMRCEANMLNGVIYSRKGRAFIWLTNDQRHLPVQVRLRMQFPIGTVTLQLEKEEHP